MTFMNKDEKHVLRLCAYFHPRAMTYSCVLDCYQTVFWYREYLQAYDISARLQGESLCLSFFINGGISSFVSIFAISVLCTATSSSSGQSPGPADRIGGGYRKGFALFAADGSKGTECDAARRHGPAPPTGKDFHESPIARRSS